MIVRESKKDYKLSLQAVKQQAGPAGEKVSRTTVHRILHKAGRKAYRPISVPMISEMNQRKRLLWARTHVTKTLNDWKKVGRILYFGIRLHFFLFTVPLHAGNFQR